MITVPRAGLTGGATASPQIEAPDTGGVVAAFGARMAEIGQGLEAERLDRQMARTRLDVMQGMTDLRLEFEQMGDPDRIDTEFPARVKAYRDEVLQGVDPRLRGDVSLMFDEFAIAHGGDLGARAIDLRTSERMAVLMRTEDTVRNAAAGAGPAGQAAYLGNYRDTLDQLVGAGVLTAEEAETRFRSVVGDVDTAGLTRLLTDDPAALVAGIEAGQLAMRLPPDQREQWRLKGLAAQASRSEAAAAEAKRAKSEEVAAAAERLKEGAGIWRSGVAFAGDAEVDKLLADPEVAATDAARDYRAARQLFLAIPGFAAKPLAEKRRLAAEARAKGAATEEDRDLILAMDTAIADHARALAEDELGYPETIGRRPVTALPDPATAGADLTGALRLRAREARALRESGLTAGGRGALFRAAERAAWSAAIRPEVNPAERVRLAGALAALGDDAERAAAELGADPVFLHVAGGLAAGGLDAATARRAFEGRRAIAAKDVALPDEPARRGAYFVDFRNLFADGTGEDGLDEAAQRDALIATAEGLYAYARRNTDDPGDAAFDETAWKQALHEAAGGTGTFGRADAVGGLGTLTYADGFGTGKYAIMLPRGVAQDDLETAQRRMLESFLAAGTYDTDGSTRRFYEDNWRAIVADGRVPVLGGQMIDSATLARVRFRPVGGDLYEMVTTAGEADTVLGDADGRPVLVDLRKLAARFGGDR